MILKINQGSPNYGKQFWENILQLLENSAQDYSPFLSQEGQLWYDSLNKNLKISKKNEYGLQEWYPVCREEPIDLTKYINIVHENSIQNLTLIEDIENTIYDGDNKNSHHAVTKKYVDNWNGGIKNYRNADYDFQLFPNGYMIIKGFKKGDIVLPKVMKDTNYSVTITNNGNAELYKVTNKTKKGFTVNADNWMMCGFLDNFKPIPILSLTWNNTLIENADSNDGTIDGSLTIIAPSGIKFKDNIKPTIVGFDITKFTIVNDGSKMVLTIKDKLLDHEVTIKNIKVSFSVNDFILDNVKINENTLSNTISIIMMQNLPNLVEYGILWSGACDLDSFVMTFDDAGNMVGYETVTKKSGAVLSGISHMNDPITGGVEELYIITLDDTKVKTIVMGIQEYTDNAFKNMGTLKIRLSDKSNNKVLDSKEFATVTKPDTYLPNVSLIIGEFTLSDGLRKYTSHNVLMNAKFIDTIVTKYSDIPWETL